MLGGGFGAGLPCDLGGDVAVGGGLHQWRYGPGVAVNCGQRLGWQRLGAHYTDACMGAGFSSGRPSTMFMVVMLTVTIRLMRSRM